MTDTPELGRSVMELATDSAGFFSDIDKASAKMTDMKGAFDKASQNAKGFGASATAAGGEAKASIGSVDTITGKFAGTLGSLGKLMAGAFAVTAVVGAVKQFADLTGQLTDLSAQTGIGTTELQKLKFAAEQSGGSLEQVTKAIGVMGKNLVEGDTGAANAMKRLGLNLDEVRKMQPGEAFSTIADAIGKVPSPMEKSALAMQVFGKSGADLLPMLTGNFQELGDQAEATGMILSEETVAAGDAFGDSMGALLTVGMAVLGKVLTPFLPLLTKLAEWASIAAGVLGDVLGGALRAVFTLGEKVIDFLAKWIGRFIEFAKSIPGVSSALESASQAFDKMKGVAYDAGVYIGAIEPASEKAGGGLKRLKLGITDVGSVTREAAKAAKEHEAAMDKAAKAGVKAYREYYESIEKVNHEMTIFVAEKLKDFGDRHQKILSDATASTLVWIQQWTSGIPVIAGLGAEIDKFGTKVDVLPPKFVPVKDHLGALSQALAQLSQVAGGTFGVIAGGLATVVGAANAARTAIDSIRAATKATSAMEGILGMTTGIMGVVSAAIAAVNGIRAIFSAFDRNQGRDLVEEFAETMGGFEALHQKLLELGDDGEALWVTLTQGVGRNNPEQARAAIAEIQAALARQAEAQAEATGATEEGARATIQTATEASAALETLNAKIQDNESVWTHWSDVVMGAIRAIADGVGSIRMPGAPAAPVTPMAQGGAGRVTRPTLFLAGEAGPEDFAFSGAGRRFGGGSGDVTVNVDGRNSFYNNPADMQRLAEVVGKAVTGQLGLRARLNTV